MVFILVNDNNRAINNHACIFRFGSQTLQDELKIRPHAVVIHTVALHFKKKHTFKWHFLKKYLQHNGRSFLWSLPVNQTKSTILSTGQHYDQLIHTGEKAFTSLWMNLSWRWHCPLSGYVSVRGSRLYHVSSVQCRSCPQHTYIQ